jgi:hypothetical protein
MLQQRIVSKIHRSLLNIVKKIAAVLIIFIGLRLNQCGRLAHLNYPKGECNMKKVLAGIGMTGVLLVGGINLALAEEAKKDALPSPAVIEQVDIVNKLIALGDARKDSVLLIAAAKLQKSLGAEAASTPTQSTATTDVLERAKQFASGRKDIIGIADDVAAQKSKGTNCHDSYCSSNQSYNYWRN